MALTTWIEQAYRLNDNTHTEITIHRDFIALRQDEWAEGGGTRQTIELGPKTQEKAHELAFILRQAARRLEAFGLELP